MGYKLERKERVEDGLRRIVREQLRRAIKAARAAGQDQEQRVHEVRTRLKRSRAALAMVGGRRVARDDRRLRDVARLLAKPRDLAVQAHTFRVFGTRLDASLPPGLAAKLAGAEQKLRLELRPKRVERKLRRSARALRKLRRTLDRWPVSHGRRTVALGIAASYRRARRGFADVRERPSERRFHDWRKQVKALWFQLRLVRGAVPELGTTLVPKVERLAEVLGTLHDLDCVKVTVELHPRWFGRRGEADLVLGLVERRRAEVEAEAIAVAETVFSGRARDVRALVEIGWEIWRQPSPRGARGARGWGGAAAGSRPRRARRRGRAAAPERRYKGRACGSSPVCWRP